MDVASKTLAVNEYLGRHAAEFEDFYLLPIASKDLVLRIGQAAERQPMFVEIILKARCILRTGHQNSHIPLKEFVIVPAQLRQVCPAERSGKAAIQD